MTPTGPEAVQFGVDTFGDRSSSMQGAPLSYAEVVRNVIDQAVLAESVGVDVIGVGEHHRDDFAVSAPDVVLASIASRTSHIRLSSAVTVLSTDDPVRVFERFSTLDAVSSGRAEIVVGRGSFTESFPLFGFDLSQSDVLFDERLDLLVHLLRERPVTWSGTTRSALTGQRVYPPTASGRLVTWVAIGSSAESAARAARHGLPVMLAMFRGPTKVFESTAEQYRRHLDASGSGVLPVGAHSPGHVADTDDQARSELYPHFKASRDRISAERGWPPVTRRAFELEAGPEGPLCVGSVETVARKVAGLVRMIGLSRFHLRHGLGPMPHDLTMRSIELYGAEVIPRVRELIDGGEAG